MIRLKLITLVIILAALEMLSLYSLSFVSSSRGEAASCKGNIPREGRRLLGRVCAIVAIKSEQLSKRRIGPLPHVYRSAHP